MLYAQVAEQGISPLQSPITQSVRTIFLGEAFSLTYVAKDVLAPFLSNTPQSGQRRLHFPIVESHASYPARSKKRLLVMEQTRVLQQRGIYCPLATDTQMKFLDMYFAWFSPGIPVLDRDSFLDNVQAGEVSLLLLNSVLLIAVTICKTDELVAAGLPSRYESRAKFYQQAKTLYDADLDTDKVDLVVSTFLMSFWWGGPDDSKDSWHWLGIASSLAQSLGMHRSCGGPQASFPSSLNLR